MNVSRYLFCLLAVAMVGCKREAAPIAAPASAQSQAVAPVSEDESVKERKRLARELADTRAELVTKHKALMGKGDYVGASDVMLPYLDAEDEEVKRLYGESEAALLKKLGSWRYEDKDDKMAGGKIRQATTESRNEVNFGFPYQGNQRATLLLRVHPRYGRDVVLLLDKGQFLCQIGGCNVAVKFGDAQPQTYSAAPPADHSSTALFIQGHDRFIANAKKVEKVLIEAQFYQEGNRVFEFDVGGLQWPPGGKPSAGPASATSPVIPPEVRQVCGDYLKERLETPATGFTFTGLKTSSDGYAVAGVAMNETKTAKSRRSFTCYLKKADAHWQVTAAHMDEW